MPSPVPGAHGCLAQASRPRHHAARAPAPEGSRLGRRVAWASLVLLATLSLLPLRAQAGSVTLTWDPVVSPVLAGLLSRGNLLAVFAVDLVLLAGIVLLTVRRSRVPSPEARGPAF